MHGFVISYGRAGDLGPFQALTPISARRGDALVVRTGRGEEIGRVLRALPPALAHAWPEPERGQILRLASAQDLQIQEQLCTRSQAFYAFAREQTEHLGLPLEVLDAELLFDGRKAVVYCLRFAPFDPREFLDRLSDPFRVLVTLHDLGIAHPPADDAAWMGSCGGGECGTGNCGSCGSGGCGTCSTPIHVPAAANSHRVSLV